MLYPSPAANANHNLHWQVDAMRLAVLGVCMPVLVYYPSGGLRLVLNIIVVLVVLGKP
jgi:hypothetical protein